MNKTLVHIVIFVLLSISVHAITADHHIECKTDDCIEGDAAIVNVSVFNDRNYPIYVFDVEITHQQEQIGLARTGGRVVLPGLTEQITFYTELPAPQDGSITTHICINLKAQDNETICADSVSTNVLHAADVSCTKDRDCASNENCIDYQCKKFRCGYCQYIQDHECRRYQCCTDIDCPEGECIAHMCRVPPKKVTTNVTSKNKTIIVEERIVAPRMQPAPTESVEKIIIDKIPEPVECADDEYLENNECKKRLFVRIKEFFRNLFKRN